MDYKKIIKNQNVRLAILRFFNFIPDKMMLKLQYRIKTGKKLNLKKPEKFSEKIQWYKLNYKNPILPKCVDKYEVRHYIKGKGLENILNELYGVYNDLNEIDINKLPNKFVIKTTSGGGNREVFLCKNKSEFDFSTVKNSLKDLATKKVANGGREWPYDKIAPRIIIEKYIENSVEDESLVDYKFYCFNGKPEYLLVINDRELDSNKKKSIYDMDFKLLAYKYADYDRINENFVKPKNFEKMKEIASILSKDFPFVRVDLYNVNGNIIFGELTFYPASGYLEKIEPEGFDDELGKKFDLRRFE